MNLMRNFANQDKFDSKQRLKMFTFEDYSKFKDVYKSVDCKEIEYLGVCLLLYLKTIILNYRFKLETILYHVFAPNKV